MKIRVATVQDAKDILRVYAPYIEKTCITFEYEIPTVQDMASRIEKTLEKYPYLVAEVDGQIVGYAYAGAMRVRKAYEWCCELSIYIDEDYQHQGIAKKLYRVLISLLELMNMQTLYACITYPNDKSEKFHEFFGFQKNAVFHKCGYKFGEWLDIFWMEKSIGTYGEVASLIPFSRLTSHQIDQCMKK